MTPRQYVYMDGVEAWSYVVVSVVSVILPIAVILISKTNTITEYISLLLSILINAAVQAREYLLLASSGYSTKGFWWKKCVGRLSSISAIVYCIVILYLLASSTIKNILNPFKFFGIRLLLVPIGIALFEGIDYAVENYKLTVVKQNTYHKVNNKSKVTNNESRKV